MPSSCSPGPKLMAQEFRALTPSPEAMGPDGGCQTKTDGVSPPVPVSSDSCGHQTTSCRVAVTVCRAKTDGPGASKNTLPQIARPS